MTRAMSLGPGRAILIHEPRRSYIAERRGRHPAGSRRRRSCGGAEGKPAGRRSASGCIGRRPRPRWELQIPAHEKPTYDPSQPMLLMRLAGRPRASPGRRPPAVWRRARVRRRRRDIGSRRAAFSVAASRADTSPSLETLVVSRGTDGSIRLVPAVSQTNSEGCGVG